MKEIRATAVPLLYRVNWKWMRGRIVDIFGQLTSMTWQRIVFFSLSLPFIIQKFKWSGPRTNLMYSGNLCWPDHHRSYLPTLLLLLSSPCFLLPSPCFLLSSPCFLLFLSRWWFYTVHHTCWWRYFINSWDYSKVKHTEVAMVHTYMILLKIALVASCHGNNNAEMISLCSLSLFSAFLSLPVGHLVVSLQRWSSHFLSLGWCVLSRPV